MSLYANDGGLRAYLVQLAGPDDDEPDDGGDVIAEQRPFVLRFAYDDPPMPDDEDDEEIFCGLCDRPIDECICDEIEDEVYGDGQ